MKGFLVQLQLHPKASITFRTVVEDGGFWLQVGRKLFKTTPEETAQILVTPGFEDLPPGRQYKVMLDVITALEGVEETAATLRLPNEGKGLSPKKPRTKKEGSFLEIALSPTHYTYARKLRGSPAYAFYDILTTVPLQRTDLASFSQRSILLDAGLLLTPAWPSIGWLPLTADRSWISYSWTANALPVTIEESKRGIRNPETEFFLVTKWFNPIDNVAYSKQTRATREELNGLQRWGLTTPEVVKEKLRLHYGLTPTGEQIAPLLLSQQPPW
jgi:hypothetical protein